MNSFFPVIITDCYDSLHGQSWLVECVDHDWFKEWTSTGAIFAVRHAERHLATYHKGK